jgi:hypothetical protein
VPYELQSIGLTIDFFNEVCKCKSFGFPEPYSVLEEFATMLRKFDYSSSINFIEQLEGEKKNAEGYSTIV